MPYDFYPPVKAGGSIEATPPRSASPSGSGAYPPVKAGGSIEAMMLMRASPRRGCYPPVKAGGSIEAWVCRGRVAARLAAIRR